MQTAKALSLTVQKKQYLINLATLSLDLPAALSQISILVRVLPCRVDAGFPSPADDHAVQRMDLMAQLIKHPKATFLLRVRGESMRDTGMFDNDVVLADRAVTAQSGHVVIAMVDGEFVGKKVATSIAN